MTLTNGDVFVFVSFALKLNVRRKKKYKRKKIEKIVLKKSFSFYLLVCLV